MSHGKTKMNLSGVAGQYSWDQITDLIQDVSVGGASHDCLISAWYWC